MFASRCLFSRLSKTQVLLNFEEVTGSALYLAGGFAVASQPTLRKALPFFGASPRFLPSPPATFIDESLSSYFVARLIR
jgi:hypothetical protein